MSFDKQFTIAVVIPCYKVKAHIVEVIKAIGTEVDLIYAVDDACPENSCDVLVKHHNLDSRVRVLTHKTNKGVGGAVMTGYPSCHCRWSRCDS